MRARVPKKIGTGRIWRVLEDTVDVECTLTKKDGVKGSIADRHESKRQEITEKTREVKRERGIGRRGEVYAVCKRSRGSTRGEIHQHRNPVEGLFYSFLTAVQTSHSSSSFCLKTLSTLFTLVKYINFPLFSNLKDKQVILQL